MNMQKIVFVKKNRQLLSFYMCAYMFIWFWVCIKEVPTVNQAHDYPCQHLPTVTASPECSVLSSLNHLYYWSKWLNPLNLQPRFSHSISWHPTRLKDLITTWPLHQKYEGPHQVQREDVLYITACYQLLPVTFFIEWRKYDLLLHFSPKPSTHSIK